MNPHLLTTSKGTFCLVEVPEIVKNFYATKVNLIGNFQSGMLTRTWKSKKLSHGTWQLHSSWPNMTADQAHDITGNSDLSDLTNIESFRTILQSLNIPVTTNLIILKNI